MVLQMEQDCRRERACRRRDSENLVVDQMIHLQKKRALVTRSWWVMASDSCSLLESKQQLLLT
jgi:hypothetical protein